MSCQLLWSQTQFQTGHYRGKSGFWCLDTEPLVWPSTVCQNIVLRPQRSIQSKPNQQNQTWFKFRVIYDLLLKFQPPGTNIIFSSDHPKPNWCWFQVGQITQNWLWFKKYNAVNFFLGESYFLKIMTLSYLFQLDFPVTIYNTYKQWFQRMKIFIHQKCKNFF